MQCIYAIIQPALHSMVMPACLKARQACTKHLPPDTCQWTKAWLHDNQQPCLHDPTSEFSVLWPAMLAPVAYGCRPPRKWVCWAAPQCACASKPCSQARAECHAHVMRLIAVGLNTALVQAKQLNAFTRTSSQCTWIQKPCTAPRSSPGLRGGRGQRYSAAHAYKIYCLTCVGDRNMADRLVGTARSPPHTHTHTQTHTHLQRCRLQSTG